MTFKLLDWNIFLCSKVHAVYSVQNEYFVDFLFLKQNAIYIFRECREDTTDLKVTNEKEIILGTVVIGFSILKNEIYMFDTEGDIFKLHTIPALGPGISSWKVHKILKLPGIYHLKSLTEKIAVIYKTPKLEDVLQFYSPEADSLILSDMRIKLCEQVKDIVCGYTKMKLDTLTSESDAVGNHPKEVLILNYGQSVCIMYMEAEIAEFHLLYKSDVCNISSVHCLEDGIVILLDNLSVVWITGHKSSEYFHLSLPCKPEGLSSNFNFILCTDGVYLWRSRPERKLVTEHLRSYFVWFMSSYKIPIYGPARIFNIYGNKSALVSNDYNNLYMVDFTKILDNDMAVLGRISGKFCGNWHKSGTTSPATQTECTLKLVEIERILKKCNKNEKMMEELRLQIAEEELKWVGVHIFHLRNFFKPCLQAEVNICNALCLMPHAFTQMNDKKQHNLHVSIVNTQAEDFLPVTFYLHVVLKISDILKRAAVKSVTLMPGCFARVCVPFEIQSFLKMPQLSCFMVLDSTKYEFEFKLPLLKNTFDTSHFVTSSCHENYSSSNVTNNDAEEICSQLFSRIEKQYILKFSPNEKSESLMLQISEMYTKGNSAVMSPRTNFFRTNGIEHVSVIHFKCNNLRDYTYKLKEEHLSGCSSKFVSFDDCNSGHILKDETSTSVLNFYVGPHHIGLSFVLPHSVCISSKDVRILHQFKSVLLRKLFSNTSVRLHIRGLKEVDAFFRGVDISGTNSFEMVDTIREKCRKYVCDLLLVTC